jgi:hypothetical protein
MPTICSAMHYIMLWAAQTDTTDVVFLHPIKGPDLNRERVVIATCCKMPAGTSLSLSVLIPRKQRVQYTKSTPGKDFDDVLRDFSPPVSAPNGSQTPRKES